MPARAPSGGYPPVNTPLHWRPLPRSLSALEGGLGQGGRAVVTIIHV